jgi:hypothetical protein
MKHAARAMRIHELRDVDNVRDAELEQDSRAFLTGVTTSFHCEPPSILFISVLRR